MLFRIDRNAVYQDFACGRLIQAGQTVQKSSFAAASRTNDAQELAFLYFKVQIIQHQQVTELFGQLLHFYLRLFVCHCPAPPLQRMIHYRIDLAAQPQKFRIGVITRTRQVDLILCLDTGWTVAQHQNAVCEVHCLLDVIGYKK